MANMSCLSSSGEDQFAVFAADDIVGYKGDEFGFVLLEMGSSWYAYVQSPQIGGFFIWQAIFDVGFNHTQPHSFKAVYTNTGLVPSVDFYVGGKLAWNAAYPNVAGKDFHLIATSHKVSAEDIDVSGNSMAVEDAVLRL